MSMPMDSGMKRLLASCGLLLVIGSVAAQEALQTRNGWGHIASFADSSGTTRNACFDDGVVEPVEHPEGTAETSKHNELAETPAVASSDAVAHHNPFAFTGYQWDAEAGLYYAKARYYDPAVGRFITQDSNTGDITDPPSLHRYAYAHNRPTAHVDPSGHQSGPPDDLYHRQNWLE